MEGDWEWWRTLQREEEEEARGQWRERRGQGQRRGGSVLQCR